MRARIAKGNLSQYLNELEEHGVIVISSGTNDRGQPIRKIKLSRKTIDTLLASSKVISAAKPVLKEFESLNIFLAGLFDPDLLDESKNSIQLLSNQYLIPVDSGYFEFLRDNLMKNELEKTRRVLIMSTRNIVREMSEDDKNRVSDLIHPILTPILDDSNSGLKRETNILLKELGLYDLPYSELEARYFSQISEHKVPNFIRTLILQDHRNMIPKLRAALMVLHKESDQPVRSIIKNEFPLLT